MSRIVSYSLLVLLLLGAVGQALLYYPRLPDRMASHFNAAGQADGWMSKRAFFGLDLGMQVGMAVLFVGITKLARQAKKKGGRVHSLIGNHEAMNVYGDLRYVSDGEFEAFVTRNSAALMVKKRTYS